jgi:hypothetical protein
VTDAEAEVDGPLEGAEKVQYYAGQGSDAEGVGRKVLGISGEPVEGRVVSEATETERGQGKNDGRVDLVFEKADAEAWWVWVKERPRA